MTRRRRPSASKRGQTHQGSSWMVAVTIGIVVLAGLISVKPSESSDSSGAPPGAKTYKKDGMTCWDKVICCNPADRSTCVRLPTCSKD